LFVWSWECVVKAKQYGGRISVRRRRRRSRFKYNLICVFASVVAIIGGFI
jgi:hypothetical protein